VSSARSNEGGLPRAHGRVPPPRISPAPERGPDANEAKKEKLRRNNLQRRARARGLELRHSAHGYSLIDAARNRVEDRNDLTLDEVELRLAP